MLTAKMTVQNIDYAETLKRVFPMVYYQILQAQSGNFLIRLMQKLGQGALPVCREILNRLSQEDRDKLLVLGLNAYSDTLTDAINTHLKSDELGRHLTIRNVGAQRRNGTVLLLAEGIAVDYPGLLAEGRVQKKLDEQLGSLSGFAQIAAKAALSAAPELLESKGMDLLQRDENQKRFLRLTQPILEAQGFVMTLSGVQLVRETTATANPVNAGFRMDAALEDHILDAIANYLQSAAKN